MEIDELKYLKAYAHRVNDSGGDLSTLTLTERQHLEKLLRKHELEGELEEIAAKLGELGPFP